MLTQLQIILTVIYLPPEIAIRESQAIDDFIIHEADRLLECNADFDAVICADLHWFSISTICENMKDNNIKPTYEQRQLDYIPYFF